MQRATPKLLKATIPPSFRGTRFPQSGERSQSDPARLNLTARAIGMTLLAELQSL
jgi:hypothetical protein